MIRCIGFISIIFVATLLVIGSANAAESEEPKEPAAAIVNGEPIPMSALESRVQTAMQWNPELRSDGNIEAIRKMRRDLLNDLIDEELVIQEGIKAPIPTLIFPVKGNTKYSDPRG